MSNIVHGLRYSVESHAKRPAVRTETTEYTYADLWKHAGRFAGGLRQRDITSGDVVGICVPAGIEYAIALTGTLRNGSVAVPIPRTADTQTVVELTQTCEIDLLVLDAPLVDAVLGAPEGPEAIVRVGEGTTWGVDFEAFTDTTGLSDFWETIARDGDDPAIYSPCSRTTPETVATVLTHDALNTAVETMLETTPGGLSETDGHLGVMPPAHLFSIVPVMVASLASGGTYYPLEQPSVEETARHLETDLISVWHVATPMLEHFVDTPVFETVDFAGVRVIGSIGAPPATDVIDSVRGTAADHYYHRYAQTETGGVGLSTADPRADCLGTADGDVQATVVSESFIERPSVENKSDGGDAVGELVLSGPTLATGYVGDDESESGAFTTQNENRWYRTGVSAYQDEQGRFFEGS